MNTKKHYFELSLYITLFILLPILVISALCIHLSLLFYPLHESGLFVALSSGAVALILHGVLFSQKRSFTHVRRAMLSFLFALFMIVCLVGLIGTHFVYFTDNPHYEETLEEWESEGKDPNLSPYSLHWIKEEPDNVELLNVLKIVAICTSSLSGLLYLTYFCFYTHKALSLVKVRRKKKKAIRSREKAYAQISKFYDYLQSGIMTEEEFQENKQRILNTLE